MERDSKLEAAVKAFTNDSALMIAHERALETERGEDALVKDPYARKLAGTKGKELSDTFGAKASVQFKLWPEFHKQWTVVRTKFIDDHLQHIIGDAEPKSLQLVNLGAGLDTRVFRLDSAAKLAASYEVDVTEINLQKNAVLKELAAVARCEQKLVSADLKIDGALTNGLSIAGYDATRKTIFLAEGLLMYLGDSQKPFLREVSALASQSSVFILNYMEGAFSKANLEAELESGGWGSFHFNCFGDEVLNYGRYLAEYPPCAHFSFVVCVKK